MRGDDKEEFQWLVIKMIVEINFNSYLELKEVEFDTIQGFFC